MDRVIHAILTKKDVDLTSLQELPGLEWLADPRVKINEIVSLAKADKHVLKRSSEFQEGTIQSYSVPAKDVRILAGILKEEGDEEHIELCDSATPSPDELKKKKKMKKDEEVAPVDEKKVTEMIESATTALKTEITDLLKTELASAKEEIIKAARDVDGTGTSASSMPIAGELDASGKKIEDGTGGGADGKVKKEEEEAKAVEVAELKTSVEKLSAELTKTSEALAKIQKSEKTSAGSKSADDLNDSVVKDDKEKSVWSGTFMKADNPKVAALFRS